MVMVIGIWMPIPARKSTKDKDLERAQARRGEGAQFDQDWTFSASRNQAKGVYFSVAGTFSQPMHERCTKFYTDIRSTHLRTQNMENHYLRLLMNQIDPRMLQGAGVDLMGISSKWGQQTSALDGSNSEIYAAKQIAKGAGPEGSMRCNDGSSIEKSRCIRKYFKQVAREQPQLFSRFSWPKQNNQSHQFLAIQQLFIVFVWARASFPIRFDQLMILLTRISHLSKPPSSLSTKIHVTIAHIVQGSYCLHASPGPTVWMLGWRSSGRGNRFTSQEPVEPGEWRWGYLNGGKYVRANHSFTFLSTRTWEILK